MKNILLYDLSNDGHHFIYNSTVMNKIKSQYNKACYYTATDNKDIINELRDKQIEVHNIHVTRKANQYLSVGYRTILLIRMLLFARINGFKKIHLFHLDSNIISLLCLLPFLLGLQVTGTLHWFPTRKWKKRILLFLLRFSMVNKIVVHGDYTQHEFNELLRPEHEQKIVNIHFPNFPIPQVSSKDNTKEVEEKLAGLTRPFFLCFGGLRSDKGIDLLLESLAPLRGKSFTLIVAGSEGYFTGNDIKQLAKQYGIEDKVFLDLRFIPDDVMDYYFNACDAVILPYRTLFSGQSGPLTEGAARNKYILGPRHGEIGHTIQTYHLGNTFEAENVEDLTDKLQQTLGTIHNEGSTLPSNNTYAPLISMERFIHSYDQFFASNG
ncbi:glycosyltransferase family 4 protein [Cohnella abietis]|nr:glycosyltransferase family 4 protein [Cohnella abietis]